MIFLKLILFLIFLHVLWIVAARIWTAHYQLEEGQEETHYVTASDGWRIALHRYRSSESGNGKLPVILCHGLGANRFNLDFDEQHSLARYLRDCGYETFVIELRGVGYSARHRLFDPTRWTWNFVDFVEKDIPAALDYVLGLTGAPSLHWVGHSMGGMVMYAFCQGEGADPIASACAISSPGHFKQLTHMRRAARLKFLLKPFPAIHADVYARAFIPLIGLLDTAVLRTTYNPENMDAVVARKAAASLVTPVSRALLMQFADWVENGGFDGEGRDYINNLHKIERPFFFMTGSADRLAPEKSVRFAYENASSSDKTFRLFATKNGDAADYGHGDIVVGRTARAEVFPAVAQWLDAHNPES